MSFDIFSKKFSPLDFDRENKNFSSFSNSRVVSGMAVIEGTTNRDLTIEGGEFFINGTLIQENSERQDIFQLDVDGGGDLDDGHYILWVEYDGLTDPEYNIRKSAGIDWDMNTSDLPELTSAEKEVSIILADIIVRNNEAIIFNRGQEEAELQDLSLSTDALRINVNNVSGDLFDIEIHSWAAFLIGVQDLDKKDLTEAAETPRSLKSLLMEFDTQDGIEIPGVTANANVTNLSIDFDGGPRFGGIYAIKTGPSSAELKIIPVSPLTDKDEDEKGIFIGYLTITPSFTLFYIKGIGRFESEQTIVSHFMPQYGRAIESDTYNTSTNSQDGFFNLDEVISNITKLVNGTLDTVYDGLEDGSNPGDGRIINADAGALQIDSDVANEFASLRPTIVGSGTIADLNPSSNKFNFLNEFSTINLIDQSLFLHNIGISYTRKLKSVLSSKYIINNTASTLMSEVEVTLTLASSDDEIVISGDALITPSSIMEKVPLRAPISINASARKLEGLNFLYVGISPVGSPPDSSDKIYKLERNMGDDYFYIPDTYAEDFSGSSTFSINRNVSIYYEPIALRPNSRSRIIELSSDRVSVDGQLSSYDAIVENDLTINNVSYDTVKEIDIPVHTLDADFSMSGSTFTSHTIENRELEYGTSGSGNHLVRFYLPISGGFNSISSLIFDVRLDRNPLDDPNPGEYEFETYIGTSPLGQTYSGSFTVEENVSWKNIAQNTSLTLDVNRGVIVYIDIFETSNPSGPVVVSGQSIFIRNLRATFTKESPY